MTDDERLGPPPIEPLSDTAWARVERGLWSRIDAAAKLGTTSPPPPAPRRWWLVAAPLAAAAAVAAIVIGTRSTIHDITEADEPARVVSGTTPSSVSFGDSHIELDADTALVMNHEAGHPTVLLERGAARFTVAPRKQRPEFVVHAGDATVRVIGTRFRVARSDERISVDVERGLVDVQFRGAMVGVGANRHWSSDSPAQTSSIAAITPPAAPAVAAEPTAPIDTADDEPTAPARTPVPHHRPKPPHAPTPKAGAEPRAAIEPESDPAPEASRAADLDRDRAEYDRLTALEARAPETALAGYLSLARGTSRWADLALFAAARLAADRHDRRAETLLGIYLQRFPSGANATDARQLLNRLKGQTPDKGDHP
ncbi:MAG TPA: FecR family protein [Kofleriaceae bacterium]|nr:FecR family protein [Kofleriaceae bacterium]